MGKWLSADGTKHLIEKIATALEAKADTNHSHTNYYSKTEIDEKIKNITGGGTVLKRSLEVKLNGGTTEGTNKFTFDGSLAKTVDITPASIGSIPWTITGNDKCVAGTLYIGNAFKNQPVVDGRISVRKNSKIDFKTSYLDFNEAFYSAYTEQEYALILLTQAIVKSGGVCTVQGNLGMHQHNGALYVGCQNKDTTKNFCQVKLLGMDATSDFAFKSELSKYIPTSRLRYLSGSETDDKIDLHYYGSDVTNKEKWNDYILPASTLAYWDGTFNDEHASSLRYCERGRLGNVVTWTMAPNRRKDDDASNTEFIEGNLLQHGGGDWNKIPSLRTLAYWDGSHSISKTDSTLHYSSLAYCKHGAFGSSVTRNMVSGIYTPSPLSTFTSEWKNIPDVNLLAYWNGRWDANNSNLQYCNKGEFGSGVTRNISHGTAAPSGSAKEGDIYIQLS